MLVLRYAYVLALVVWLGGMVVLGAVVAPTTFELLQGAAPGSGGTLASQLFGATLARFHTVEYGCGAVLLLTLAAMAVLGPRPTGFAVRLALAAIMLAIAVYVGHTRIDSLHQLSTRLMMVNVAGALVLLYWEARDHGR
jgi:hypothetical protein